MTDKKSNYQVHTIFAILAATVTKKESVSYVGDSIVLMN